MTLIEKVNEFLKVREMTKEILMAAVKDKSIPLDERWEAFTKSELGTTSNYYWRFESLDADNFYDTMNKYEYCDVDMVIDHFSDYEDADGEETKATEEQINNFKEEAMERFIYSWQFDW